MSQEALIPMLAVQDAAAAIDFYARAFDAHEVGERIVWDGKVAHAEIEISGARVMIADEFPGENVTPAQLGGTTVLLHLAVPDCDDAVRRAEGAGAHILRVPAPTPHGRIAKVKDPFGHIWMLNGPNE